MAQSSSSVPTVSAVPGLACVTVTNGDQLVVVPGGFRALVYSVTVELCYDSARNIVQATPSAFAQEQLFQSELAAGLPGGTIGRISITSTTPNLPFIRLGDTPTLQLV